MALNVLVVDDDPNFVAALTLYLGKKGFGVRGVNTVTEALDVFTKEKFDAAVVDVCIAKFSGLVFLKSIKSSRHTIPVIMMSGSAQSQRVRECLNLGAYDFLFKPFRLEVLHGILHTIENRKERFANMGVELMEHIRCR